MADAPQTASASDRRSYAEWDTVMKDLSDDEAGDATPGHDNDSWSSDEDEDVPSNAGDSKPPEPEPDHALSDEQKSAMKDLLGDGKLLKAILTPGRVEESVPSHGSKVVCHYTGRLLNGAKFDSSRDRADPFNFKIGSGVIDGWSKGVATMHPGEVARFCIAPELAYGPAGSPPNIPPNATLQFEIELISFSEFDDVAGTQGKVKMKLMLEGSGWETPSEYDECIVTCSLQLDDGTVVYDCVRAETTPRQAVILGLGALLKSLKKGGKCEAKIDPLFGFGHEGRPAVEGAVHVPAGAHLKATVELHGFVKVADASEGKTGSVLVKMSTDGDGWEKPSKGHIVFLSYSVATAAAPDEPILSSGGAIEEHTLGAGTLLPGLDRACMEMKKGAKSSVRISSGYGMGAGHWADRVPTSEDLIAEITLDKFTKVDNVTDDGGVRMMKIKESSPGADYKMPKDFGTVTVLLTLSLEDGTVVAEHEAESPLVHRLVLDTPLIPAIEPVVKKMKRGGEAKLIIEPAYGFGTDGDANRGVPGGAKLSAVIQLVSFDNPKETWEMTESEKLEAARERKNAGTDLFKTGQFGKAVICYESANSCLASDSKLDDAQKAEAKALKINSHTNLSICHSKLKDDAKTLKSANEALKLDSACVKALFRRASVNFATGNFLVAKKDIVKILRVDPGNKSATKLNAKLEKSQAAQDTQDRKRYRGMFDKPLTSSPEPKPSEPAVPTPAAEPVASTVAKSSGDAAVDTAAADDQGEAEKVASPDSTALASDEADRANGSAGNTSE